jgi:hypothetical protein
MGIIMPPKRDTKKFFDKIQQCYSNGTASKFASFLVTFDVDDRTTSHNLKKTMNSGLLKRNKYPNILYFGVSKYLTVLTKETSDGVHYSKGRIARVGVAIFSHQTPETTEVLDLELKRTEMEIQFGDPPDGNNTPPEAEPLLVSVPVGCPMDKVLQTSMQGNDQRHWYVTPGRDSTKDLNTYNVYPVDTSDLGMAAQLVNRSKSDEKLYVVTHQDFWEREDAFELMVDTTTGKPFPKQEVMDFLDLDWIIPTRKGVYLAGTKTPWVSLRDMQHKILTRLNQKDKNVIFSVSRDGERFVCQRYSKAYGQLLKTNGFTEYYV